MKVQVIPLTSFVHGHIDAHEGKPFNCEKGLADEFERAGLVRVKRAPVQATMEAAPITASAAGKAPDDGAGQPSSASPAAPVSPMTTTPTPAPSAPGVKPRRRAGT